MSRRLTLATWFFALVGVVELGDLLGLALTLRSPEVNAALLGISRNGQIVRAIVLALLAAQVALGALIAATNLRRRNWLWFRMGGLLTAVGLVIYGLFQTVSAAVQLRSIAFALVGLLYVGLGLLAWYFTRSPVSAQATSQ